MRRHHACCARPLIFLTLGTGGLGRLLTLVSNRWERTGEELFSNSKIVNLMNNVVAVIARADSPRLTTEEVWCPHRRDRPAQYGG